MKLDLNSLLTGALILLGLVTIIAISIFTRSSTLNLPTVLDYDPWWWFRHAKEIYDNNFEIPKWDILSYYPPGRPYQLNQGWPYTIAALYAALHNFTSITFMQSGILAPLILVALAPIPAFLLGRLLSNEIGGLVGALFVVVAPTFISVSMAGYADSDALTVFYTLLTIYTIFLAVKYSNKKWFISIPLYALATATNLIYIFNWGGGWFTSLLFLAFIPAFIVFRLLEEMWHQKKFKFHWKNLQHDAKTIFIPLVIIFVLVNGIGYFMGFKTMFHSLIGGLAFTGIGGEPLIVNISVAELQKINIFTLNGFYSVASRVGLLPTIITLIGLPVLALYKFFRREKINYVEIFLFLWALVTFYLILKGVRFSLLFSIAAGISSGYVIGNIFNYLKNKNILLLSSVSAIFLVFILSSVSAAYQIGYSSGAGLAIGQNWYDALDWLKANADKDSLVATWWDPGHIITGYTGLKAHADGAHCNPASCIPYNHNIRIRDMGRLMSTNNETESIQIIKKYTHLTEEQCNAAKQLYGDIMPADACKDVSEVYVIASDDLIGKYFWMNCFGTFDLNLWDSTGGKQWNCDQKNYISLPLTTVDKQGLPIYTLNSLTIGLVPNGTSLLAVINSPGQGIRSAVVSDLVYFQNGVMQRVKVNATNSVDGMVWVDPSFRQIIFMDPKIRDSVFTKMFFFNGEGLNKYHMVFQNPQVKIFKADIS